MIGITPQTLYIALSQICRIKSANPSLIDCCDNGEFATPLLRVVSYRQSQSLHHHPSPLGSHLRRRYFLSIQFSLHYPHVYITATTQASEFDANKP